MADVPVKIFRSRKTLVGVSPSIPSGVEGEPLPPVNPPGSNPSGGSRIHNDLEEIQGGIEGERYHLTLAEKDDIVTISEDQTITGAKLFENELVRIEGTNPELRLRASSNVSSVKFRTINNEDAAVISYNNETKKFVLATNIDNADIVIAPNGTGKVNLPNIPDGTGESLMRDTDGNIVKGAISVTGIFTPTLTASGLSFTYSVQKGFYTRIGDLVFVNIRIVFSATGTPTGGNLRVNALPFSGLVNEIQRLPVLQMQNSGYTDAQVALLAFEINGNATNGNLISKNSSIAPLTTYTNCGLIIQGQYKTSN